MSAAGVLFAHCLLAVAGLPLLAACLYLLALTLLSRRPPVPAPSSRRLRFDVVVPAHNESAVIARCLSSLQRMNWPHEGFRILVVADNCDDATAGIARAAGAQVLERVDPLRPGKGHALRLAFDVCRRRAWADAVVVVDADSEVSPNLLEAFASRLERGAAVIQARYAVLNPGASWRTSLMAIAYGAFHDLRSRARERLRLSCGLRGNGWCIRQRALEQVPFHAFSQTEDIEYGNALGLAGLRVAYADEASVYGEMECRESIALRQRQRWEEGRFGLVRTQAWPLLRAAVVARSRVAFDLALDLLVPPLSYLVLHLLVFLVAVGVASLWLSELRVWFWPGGAAAFSLMIYVLRGWQLSQRGIAGLRDLLLAPWFVLWKLTRVLRRHAPHAWAPTRRRDS